MLKEDITPITQGVKRQSTTTSSMLINPKAKKVNHKLYQQQQGVAKKPEGEAGHQGGLLKEFQDIHRTEQTNTRALEANKNTIRTIDLYCGR